MLTKSFPNLPFTLVSQLLFQRKQDVDIKIVLCFTQIRDNKYLYKTGIHRYS